MIGIGLLGYGYWGPNLARNIAELDCTDLVAIADAQPKQLAMAGARFPGVELLSSAEELLRHPKIDAVAVATPTATHAMLAEAALRAGKHVWVEKPLASSSAEVLKLLRLAEERSRVLFVDHTFVYTPAVQEMARQVARGELGQLCYYDSVRVNLGLFQRDVNVLWDLAVHDLSIMDFLIAEQPVAVSATGMAHVPGRPENVAFLTCYYDSQLIAHTHVSWLAPVKIRRTLLGGDRRMIVYDELEPSEKIKIYDCGVEVGDDPEGRYELLVGYRTGDMRAPHLARTEALRAGMQHFVESIATGEQPATGGLAGYRVVRILEAADRSLARRGAPEELSWDL